MKERQQRQAFTLEMIALLLQSIRFANAQAQHLRNELIAHYERIAELVTENHNAKLEPQFRRGHRRLTKDELREHHMLPLSRRGRKLARIYPELTAALKVPHKNATVDEIADAAERMADALKPHLKVLIEAKYPRNCLAAMRRYARALRADADAAEAARALLNRSNRALTEELSLARDTIREFDWVLRSLPNHEEFKTLWRIRNRVGARKGRPTKRRLAARERAARKQGRGTADS